MLRWAFARPLLVAFVAALIPVFLLPGLEPMKALVLWVVVFVLVAGALIVFRPKPVVQ